MNGERKKECVCECLEREGERERQKKMNSTNVRQTSTQLPLIWLNQTFAYKGNFNCRETQAFRELTFLL